MATNILMPALSPTMEEGKLSRWLVKEGDTVKSGDILAEIETDKATMEFEAVDEGKIGKILVPEGSEGVKVNAPIAVLLEDGEKADAAPDISSAMASIKDAVSAEAKTEQKSTPSPGGRGRDGTAGAGEGAATPPSQTTQTSSASSALPRKGGGESSPSTEDRVFASPLARRIAEQKGVDLSNVSGSGPRGRIVKADIEGVSFETRPSAAPQDDAKKIGAQKVRHPEVAAQPPSKGDGLGVAPIPDARMFFKPEDYEEIPHDSMRKAIAKRLTSSKTLIPHFYLTIDCNIDGLLATRTRLNEAGAKSGFKLSVNDFVVKASALALMRVPEVNASWTDTAILRHKHADVGVAVALDFGLITPIVFRADEKGLAVISNEIKSLAERAKTKKLKPQEFEGGGFAVSNLGMFGIKEFTGVINPPHAAILAVGAGEQRAIVKNGRLEAATMMTVTMSCDHRVVDGATGARFLEAFRQFIEEPAAMLL